MFGNLPMEVNYRKTNEIFLIHVFMLAGVPLPCLACQIYRVLRKAFRFSTALGCIYIQAQS